MDIKAGFIKLLTSLEGADPQDIKEFTKVVKANDFPQDKVELAQVLGLFFGAREVLLKDHEANVDRLEKYINDAKATIDNEPSPKKTQGNKSR